MKKLIIIVSGLVIIGLVIALITGSIGGHGFEGKDDIQYVLIYNPRTSYDPIMGLSLPSDLNEYKKANLSTGHFKSQIQSINLGSREGDDEEEPDTIPYIQPNTDELPEFSYGHTESRDEMQPPDYIKGDTYEFYVGSPGSFQPRRLETMTCAYSGEHCCIWVLDSCISDDKARSYGKEFDDNIYSKDVETYGTARFVRKGGKVHILYHSFGEDSLTTVGYFSDMDLHALEDFDSSTQRGIYENKYTYNLDHAIIHVNADRCNQLNSDELIYATEAHEFQHLIYRTSIYDYQQKIGQQIVVSQDTWLNEAMSGYIENVINENEKESRYRDLTSSSLVREGRSLYTFEYSTKGTVDLGAYGSVYLFSEYLANQAGKEVFRRIHDYYRDGNPDAKVAAALYHSVPDKLIQELNGRYSYPAEMEADTAEETFMSKLTLDFYLSMLAYGEGDPEAFRMIDARYLCYDGEKECLSVGLGGRVLIRIKNGTYTIPDDADQGLIYIKLNGRFEPVDIVYDK